jgi:hypothetical protein
MAPVKVISRLAVLACFLSALAVVSFGGPATARPKSWTPFCAQLRTIKKTSETPGGWSNGPDDPYGLKKFKGYYSNLKRLSPSTSMISLLKAAHPILANPVAVAQSSKKARAAFRSMGPTLTKQCQLSVSDVFKVSVN